jgi:hypothetical protein
MVEGDDVLAVAAALKAAPFHDVFLGIERPWECLTVMAKIPPKTPSGRWGRRGAR